MESFPGSWVTWVKNLHFATSFHFEILEVTSHSKPQFLQPQALRFYEASSPSGVADPRHPQRRWSSSDTSRRFSVIPRVSAHLRPCIFLAEKHPFHFAAGSLIEQVRPSLWMRLKPRERKEDTRLTGA